MIYNNFILHKRKSSMKKIFLLGGHDLEMIEIKKILQQKKQKFFDKELSWGAKLSDYKEYFNDKDEFIAIELEEDIDPPKHYEIIDHHGKLSCKPSALQQIAKILNIELTRWQKLVAANDARYIEGMKLLDATPQEVAKIRAADRVAQGISKKDEKLAEQSLNIVDLNYRIYSKTDHFSAVSDRIYDKFTQYIIYNDKKILFYGYVIKKLIAFMKRNSLEESHYYYGGGDFGFLGIKEGILNDKSIKNLLEEFDKVQEDMKKIISYHTFMLPFTFEGTFNEKKDWFYKLFKVEENETYNEYLYFYRHVQDVLFNTKEGNKGFSQYYEYKIQSGSYVIDCKQGLYELAIDGISLRIFQTGVAILSFNLINRDYLKQKDILAINDYGRRIYPPYLDLEDGLKGVKNSLLANSISLQFKDQKMIKEDFTTFEQVENIYELLPSFVTELIKENFTGTIKPIIDDRMFVISQYNNEAVGKKFQTFNEKTNTYTYENDDFWYEYIFVDGNGKNCQSKHMSKQLIKASTYDRWVEYGTLFGVSRYSFVAVSGGYFGEKILNAHIRTIYFQMFTLLLAYRATIIKFSDEIQDVTNQEEQVLSQKTRELYKKYLNFLNKLYFKEVTAQDQGIELYNKAMDVMDIPKYMQDLDNEMNELHSYVDMIEEKKRNKKLDNISLYGGVLLGASVLTGFFGMNVGSSANFSSWLVYPLIGFVTWLGYRKILKKEHHE